MGLEKGMPRRRNKANRKHRMTEECGKGERRPVRSQRAEAGKKWGIDRSEEAEQLGMCTVDQARCSVDVGVADIMQGLHTPTRLLA